MVEFYASIGGDGVDAVSEGVARLEPVLSSSTVSAAAPTDGHWLETANRDDVDVLVAGEVFSVHEASGALHSVAGENTAEVILDRYAKQGRDSLWNLNGEFVALVADHGSGETAIVTDRIGARPGFRTQTDDGTRITTNLQLFAADDSVELTFDLDYLTEYFVFQRTFGIATPLVGVEKLPPASVLVFDEAGTCIRDTSYWEPTYEPMDREYEYFVREFADRLSDVFDERLRAAGEPGLLLSGGSDSRLLAHLLDGEATAYHMNDHENEEVGVARAIADHTGLAFEFLERDADYYLDVLNNDSAHDNFTSWFYESHAVGFEDRLADATLVTGLFCDILFRGYYLPMRHVNIPLWNKTLKIPTLDEVSPEAFVSHRLSRMAYGPAPPYLRHGRSIEEILRENYRITEAGIVDHGIRYPSVEPLYFSCYPLTNDYARDYFGTLRIGPRWTPFLDARMIDLQLSYPLDYMLEKNIVNDVIKRFDPELLSIPHGETGVRLDRSRLVHELSKQIRAKLDDIRNTVGLSEASYATRGSWQNHRYLFRNNPRFDEFLYSNEVEELLGGLDCIDRNHVYELYESGGSYLDFYPLITMLEMPVTQAIART